jgi:hypothetical protein
MAPGQSDGVAKKKGEPWQARKAKERQQGLQLALGWGGAAPSGAAQAWECDEQKQTEANVPGSYRPWERTGTCLQAKKEAKQCFRDSSRGR